MSHCSNCGAPAPVLPPQVTRYLCGYCNVEQAASNVEAPRSGGAPASASDETRAVRTVLGLAIGAHVIFSALVSLLAFGVIAFGFVVVGSTMLRAVLAH